jgi:hypothetical protein
MSRPSFHPLSKLNPNQNSQRSRDQDAVVDKATGLMVDIQLTRMEVLESLAAALTADGSSKGAGGGSAEDEARSLLEEADLIAKELSGP